MSRKRLKHSGVVFKYLIVVVLFTCTTIIVAQDNSGYNSQTFIDSINSIYGTDDVLVNGPLYLPEHTRALGHPCFIDNNFHNGTLFVHDRTYPDVNLKYDIELNRLILQTSLSKGAIVKILLNTAYIDSFYIADHRFVNAAQLKINDTLTGFFELIYQNGFKFIIKHYKEFRGDYNEKTPFGRYTSDISNYYITAGGELNNVSTRRSFLKYFTPNKKEIKRYMKQNMKKYRKADKTELYRLMNYIYEISRN